MQLNAARYGIDSFVQLNLGAIGRDGARQYLSAGADGTEVMLNALIQSVAGMPVTATEVARYLGHHVAYGRNEPLGELPNRAFLKAALDLELATLQPLPS